MGIPGYRLKMARGETHLDDLKTAVVSLLQPNPERVDGEFDPNTSQWVYRTTRRPTTRIGWSAIIGDFLNNYRSALDYILCALVLKARKGVTNQHSFPIVDNTSKWTSKGNKLSGLRRQVQNAIESEQPYHAGQQQHPLSLLRDLNNWDKHQSIHTTVQVASGRFVIPTAHQSQQGIIRTETEHWRRGPLQPDGIVLSIEIVPEPGAEPVLNRPLEIVYDIAFERGPGSIAGLPVITTVESIAAAVEGVVSRLEKFL